MLPISTMESSTRDVNSYFFDLNPTPMIIFDLDSLGILKVNEASIETYGYTEGELLKMTIKEIHSNEEVPVLLKHLEGIDKKLQHPHFRHQKKNGSIFYAQVSSRNFTWNGTEAQLAVIHDVTTEVEAQIKAVKAEKEVEEERNFSDMLIQNLPDAFWLMDKEGNVVRWNQQLERTSGFSKEEMHNRFILDFFAEEEHVKLREALAEVFLEGQASAEGTLMTKGGEAIPHALNGIKFMYRDEPYIAGIGVNIKGQKDYLHKLEETKEQLSRAQNTAKLGSWEMDFKDMQLSWSDQMYELFDLSKKDFDVTFENFLEHVPVEERKELQNDLNDAMAGELNEEIEHRIVTSEGEIRHVVERGEVEYDTEGNPIKVRGTMQDITERKNNEQAIRKEKLRFELATKSSSDVIWDWDFAENRIWWDEGLKKVFGYADYEAASDPDWWEQQIHFEDRERAEKSINNFLASNRRYWALSYKFLKADGSLSYVEENGYAVRDDKGKPVRMIGAMRDITEKKKSELRIQKSLEEKEALLAEVHHRVKNNLAIISGLLELQVMSEDDQHVQHLLRDSQSRIYSMAKVHEMLYKSGDFANISFNQYLIQIIEHISNSLVADNIEFHFKNRDEELYLDINQAIPCALIINEVLNNAIEHAFKGKQSGNISLGLRKMEDQVEIEIFDDGIGIDKKLIDNNEFLPSSLGQTLIQTLVTQISGESYYSINEKGGTTFELTFKPEKKKGSANTYF